MENKAASRLLEDRAVARARVAAVKKVVKRAVARAAAKAVNKAIVNR